SASISGCVPYWRTPAPRVASRAGGLRQNDQSRFSRPDTEGKPHTYRDGARDFDKASIDARLQGELEVLRIKSCASLGWSRVAGAVWPSYPDIGPGLSDPATLCDLCAQTCSAKKR